MRVFMADILSSGDRALQMYCTRPSNEFSIRDRMPKVFQLCLCGLQLFIKGVGGNKQISLSQHFPNAAAREKFMASSFSSSQSS